MVELDYNSHKNSREERNRSPLPPNDKLNGRRPYREDEKISRRRNDSYHDYENKNRESRRDYASGEMPNDAYFSERQKERESSRKSIWERSPSRSPSFDIDEPVSKSSKRKNEAKHKSRKKSRKSKSNKKKSKKSKRYSSEEESSSSSSVSSDEQEIRKKVSKNTISNREESSEEEYQEMKPEFVKPLPLKTKPKVDLDESDLITVNDFKKGGTSVVEEEDDFGPAPPLEFVVKSTGYGGDMLDGEGSAMAAYLQSGKRIPRRGEIGLTSDDITKYEEVGFVMSGSRHQMMNSVRVRKENQVISAEEKKSLLVFSQQERMRKEAEIIGGFKELVSNTFARLEKGKE
ncbi:hypothetical protein HK099_008316 [Clydaea vesicula]|uniref:NF-kappa-B-activating protein C-terminal domain-containing protein n=1 Tax=Clydaea vesicula TaxID=447962 RepID=A0AAD5UBV0_9FUNG|nr:hypothetical protein HK099_008316 [Clydaea vesicula]